MGCDFLDWEREEEKKKKERKAFCEFCQVVFLRFYLPLGWAWLASLVVASRLGLAGFVGGCFQLRVSGGGIRVWGLVSGDTHLLLF